VGNKIFWHWTIAVISKKLVGNKLWNGGQLPNWLPLDTPLAMYLIYLLCSSEAQSAKLYEMINADLYYGEE
jgi:hypothetical protein